MILGSVGWLSMAYLILEVVIGFSIIIFVHELGHFLAAKWMGVRVDRFAIGFFYRLVGWRRGEGLTFGPKPNYKADELTEKGYGETDYCLNAFPFGGYVKMLGEDDLLVNEETGEIKRSEDPRAFPNKPVGRRMIVVSAGVVFNMLFAILLYMFVYLAIGKDLVAPVIGLVDPGGSAGLAGLQPGDRILAIDGSTVDSFDDVMMSCMLAEGPIRFEIERGGDPVRKEFVVDPRTPDGRQGLIGISPSYSTKLALSEPDYPAPPGLEPGDRVTHINGEPVANPFEMQVAYARCGGQPVEMVVERTDPDDPGATRAVTTTQWPILRVESAALDAKSDADLVDSRHLLGFQRRHVVDVALPGAPGEQAGLRSGDVVARWGTVINPLYKDITASIAANDRKPISIAVERDGELVTLEVTPKRDLALLQSNDPRVGLVFGTESRRAIVADIAVGTPASVLKGIPRGAEIVAVAGEPVENWLDVFEQFKAHAGETVAVRYRSGEDEGEGRMPVPTSMVNELNLPPGSQIVSIDGEDEVQFESGRRAHLPSALAVQALLERHIGQEVTVEYVRSIIELEPLKASFKVRGDNTNPWQMRVSYGYVSNLLTFELLLEKVTADGNPLRALAMGGRQTLRLLVRVYQSIKGMVSPASRVGVRQVAGPIGIVRIAVAQAEAGTADLLFFLAFISINLAVLNFLPLPVLDGGMMVFLILEKIRRKPLSMRVQVIATLSGLALIVLVFLFVTFQDIVKLWGGSV